MDAAPAATTAASPAKQADPRICASFMGEDKIDQDDLFCRRVNRSPFGLFNILKNFLKPYQARLNIRKASVVG